jgi:YtkA-like
VLRRVLIGAALLLAAACGPSAGATGGGGGSCEQQQLVEDVKVTLTSSPCPARAGRETLSVRVLDARGNAVPARRVTVRYQMNGMDMPGLPKDVPTSSSGDAYQVTLPLGMSGPWGIAVTVERASGAPVTGVFVVRVP